MKQYARYINPTTVEFPTDAEEEWRKIPGYSENYEASNLGRVRVVNYRHSGKPRIMKPSIINKYYRLGIMDISNKKRTRAIHRLVALAFIPNPANLPEVNHKDENKLNNNVENLEWCTQSHNIKHSLGLHTEKKSNKRKTIRCIETGEIFESIRQACKHFNITKKRIQDMLDDVQNTAAGHTFEVIHNKD